MRKYLIILLLSTSFLLQYGCVSLKGYEKDNSLAHNLSAVLSDGYKTALYKASFDLASKHYSGLFYFKIMPDSSHRIVFLSEIGLNIMDLEYKNGNFKLISCQEFMNKGAIINALQNDLKLLIDLPSLENMTVYKQSDKGEGAAIKCKDKNGKLFYFTSNNEVTKIIKVKGLGQTETVISGYNMGLPQKIELIHKKIKLSIKLNLIEVK